jgi:hypothetical protein
MFLACTENDKSMQHNKEIWNKILHLSFFSPQPPDLSPNAFLIRCRFDFQEVSRFEDEVSGVFLLLQA